MSAGDDDDWRGFSQHMKDQRKARHAQWKAEATAAIAASGIPHRMANNGETILFREAGKPRVDYYPSTGRATINGSAARSFGPAAQFLAWYRKQ